MEESSTQVYTLPGPVVPCFFSNNRFNEIVMSNFIYKYN